MKQKKKEQKQRKAEYQRHLNELNSIRSRLSSSYAAFDNITDPDMMDACIFEISALKSRYNHAVSSIRKLPYWSEYESK